MKIGQIKYQFVIIVVLGVYIYYLTYRLRYTINPNALLLSLSFFYADVHGFFSMALFSFQLWNPLERKAPPPLPGLSVDIYIPTYNEDISIIKKTVLGCSSISYPHKTYLLDDGNRPELAKKAAEWGCGYITRTERLHAKAGNLNHALLCTDGEFVVIFDTDCVPQPDFLDKTIGYFHDQKLAFVQTPHNYYNIDSFQFKVNTKKEKFWIEQNLFYRLIMPGRDYWNSAFFAGTAAVFRKEALEAVGGFATGSITEDFHTTINLYAQGWKGVYHNEVLSNELAAKDLKNYHIQQLRWAEGNLSMFFKCNPLFRKGLSVPQRICFFSTIFGWLFGFPKLIYLVIPIFAVFFGLNPIRSFDFPFIWRCVFFLTVLVTGFEIVTRGYGKIFYCECFLTMNFFVVIKAAFRSVFALFGLKSIFKVTGKGGSESISIFGIMPQLVIGLFCFCAVIWGALKLYYNISSGWVGNASVIFWNSVNGLLIFSVVDKITKPYYKRKDFRFVGAVPVHYSVEGSGGTIAGFGITRDINECGVSLITFSPLPSDRNISLSLYLDKKILDCKVSVLFTQKTDRMGGNMFIHGTKFEGVSTEEMDLINLYCFNTILPRFRYKYGRKPSRISRMFYNFSGQKYIRKHTRKKITLPVVTQNNDKTPLIAVTNDISISGLSFTSYVPLESGAIVPLKTITPFGTLEGEGEVRQAREIVTGHSYFIGVKFTRLFKHSENILFDIIAEK